MMADIMNTNWFWQQTWHCHESLICDDSLVSGLTLIQVDLWFENIWLELRVCLCLMLLSMCGLKGQLTISIRCEICVKYKSSLYVSNISILDPH